MKQLFGFLSIFVPMLRWFDGVETSPEGERVLEAVEAHWGEDPGPHLISEAEAGSGPPQPPLSIAELTQTEGDDRSLTDVCCDAWDTTDWPVRKNLVWKLFRCCFGGGDGGVAAVVMDDQGVLAKFFLYDIQHFLDENDSLSIPDGSAVEPYNEEDGHMGYELWLFRENSTICCGICGDGNDHLTSFWKCSVDEWRQSWLKCFGAISIQPLSKKLKGENERD